MTDGLIGAKNRLGMNYYTKKQWKEMYKNNAIIFRFSADTTTFEFTLTCLEGNSKRGVYDTEFDTFIIYK